MEETLKTERARAKVLTGPSACANRQYVPNISTPNNPSPSLTSIPKLTDADCALLNAHSGCYKCCHFYQDHKGTNCPHGFPDPTVYKSLTEADTLLAKPKLGKKVKVVAVLPIDNRDPDPEFIAAVGMSSSVIGNGTDSDEYVDPLHAPHLYWDCLVNVPSTEVPFPVHALIDDACSTVLIRPDLADALELRQVALSKPLNVGLAIDSGEVKKFELTEFVSFKVYSVGTHARQTSLITRLIMSKPSCFHVVWQLLVQHSTMPRPSQMF